MTIEATSKENDYTKHSANHFQSWHLGTSTMKVLTLQTALQKRNRINVILFFITSYTCYIYPTTISGNLKRNRFAHDTEFKLKVVQYAEA